MKRNMINIENMRSEDAIHWLQNNNKTAGACYWLLHRICKRGCHGSSMRQKTRKCIVSGSSLLFRSLARMRINIFHYYSEWLWLWIVWGFCVVALCNSNFSLIGGILVNCNQIETKCFLKYAVRISDSQICMERWQKPRSSNSRLIFPPFPFEKPFPFA